ncbi:MAG: type IX secretion system protein PorQ [Bacteroidia bacterium]
MKFSFSLFVFLLLFGTAGAQIGGQSVYSFLSLSNSTRVQALGGKVVSLRDDDVNMAYQNPGLINSSMNGNLSLTYTNYFAGINFGNVAYAINAGKKGTVAASIQYVDYGSFERADQTGLITGNFTAGDYCLTAGYGYKLDSVFTFGANIKAIYSAYDTYSSFGLAADFGASYKSPDQRFTAGLVLKNFGTQLSTFTPGNKEKLPTELQIGLSKELEHVPLKFSFVAHNLQQSDLTWKDPRIPEESIDPLTGDTVINKIGVANKIMRHAIFGAEFNVSKAISLQLGYNYQRRQEMKVSTRLGTVGISWGVGVKIYKFSIAYSRSAYHLAGSPNQFTLVARLSEFYRKN